MTLGGIAVAMGELVDDAIVDVENIFRRLNENNASPNPRPALTVVYQASREVRSAIVFGTGVVILVFLPLFAMSGVEGRLFAPLGIAYIVSILASLLVSLTVTPVLSYYLLPNSKATHRHKDGLLLRVLKWFAGYLVRFSMRFGGSLLVLTWLLVGVSVFVLSQLGADFLPQFDEGSVQVNLTLPAGSSLEASSDAAQIIDAKLTPLLRTAANPDGEILHFVRRTGRAELDEHAQPVNMSEYILSMNSAGEQSREETIETLLGELKQELPGVDIEIDQPLAHLISHMLSGVYAHVAIKIYGDDLASLQRLAQQVKGEIADIPGITTPVIESQEFVDELHIVLRPEELAYYGVSRAYVAEYIQTALRGNTVSQVLEGSRRFDLVVRHSAGDALLPFDRGRGGGLFAEHDPARKPRTLGTRVDDGHHCHHGVAADCRRRSEAGAGNSLPGRHGHRWGAADLDVLRIPDSPRIVLEVQRERCPPTISGEVDGTPYAGDFKEEAHGH